MSKIVDALLEKIRTGQAGKVSLRRTFENASPEDLTDMGSADLDTDTDNLIAAAIESAGLNEYVELVFSAIAPPSNATAGVTDATGSGAGSAPTPDGGTAPTVTTSTDSTTTITGETTNG